MDGNVHFNSRPAAACRLSVYMLIIIAAGILLLPSQSTGVYDTDRLNSRLYLELAASHPAWTPDTPSAESSERRAVAAEKRRSTASNVRVKTGYHAIIEQAGRRHGVDAALIQAIIMAESSYNPRAVSNRGAAGLMQLMPATADSLGVKDRFDPEHNINGGVRYFKHLLVRFDGDTRLALAAYNAGARKVRQYNGIPPYKATRSYISRVFRYYERYKDLAGSAPKKV
jgi:soluble lytic murein transglycosylase-like protein